MSDETKPTNVVAIHSENETSSSACKEEQVEVLLRELTNLVRKGTHSGKAVCGLVVAVTYDNGSIYTHVAGRHDFPRLYGMLQAFAYENMANSIDKRIAGVRESLKDDPHGLRRALEEGM